MHNKLKYFNDFSINKDITSMENSIRVDMGLNGDDAFYFLKDFEKRYNFEILKKIDFEKYFHSEYELFNFKKLRNIDTELKISELFEISNHGNAPN